MDANEILTRLAALSDPEGIGGAEWALGLATDVEARGIVDDEDLSATQEATDAVRALALEVAALSLAAKALLGIDSSEQEPQA